MSLPWFSARGKEGYRMFTVRNAAAAALLVGATLATGTAVADTHATATPSSPARPAASRMTSAYRQVGRGTASRLNAVASERRGDRAAAAKQHAEAAKHY